MPPTTTTRALAGMEVVAREASVSTATLYAHFPSKGDLFIAVVESAVANLANDVEPLRLNDIDAVPGSTVPVYFQSGDGEGSLMQVPVLDGALVAHVVADVVEDPATAGHTIRFNGGSTAIATFLRAAAG